MADHRYKFLFLSAKFPGRVHDSRVLKKTLAPKFDRGFRPFKDSIILADSAYSGSDWLIKKVEKTQDEMLQKFYE